MTAHDRSVEASENLLQTYFCLGSALASTELVDGPGFKACIGTFEHPICNFAARLDLDPRSAKRLAELASTRRTFNVYSLPSDRPSHVGELLLRAGFRVAYRLEQMFAEPTTAESPVRMEMCATVAARMAVTTFMTEQFFSRQTSSFRATVAQATAEAVGLPIYSLPIEGRMSGALMLRESNGVTGLYNLCVASDERGRGIGKLLTSWTLAHAAAQGKCVALQCDAQLQAWYSAQGFRSCGAVDVFTLSKSNRSDIIKRI